MATLFLILSWVLLAMGTVGLPIALFRPDVLKMPRGEAMKGALGALALGALGTVALGGGSAPSPAAAPPSDVPQVVVAAPAPPPRPSAEQAFPDFDLTPELRRNPLVQRAQALRAACMDAWREEGREAGRDRVMEFLANWPRARDGTVEMAAFLRERDVGSQFTSLTFAATPNVELFTPRAGMFSGPDERRLPNGSTLQRRTLDLRLNQTVMIRFVPLQGSLTRDTCRIRIELQDIVAPG